MKISVELDLRHISEDPDYYIESKIIQQVVGSLDDKIKKAITYQFDLILIDKINTCVESVLSEFMDRNIIITDRYGDEVSRYESTKELLKERFDEFITESVDKDGKPVKDKKGCYISGQPRIKLLMDGIINEQIKNLKPSISKDLATDITTRISKMREEIKKEITDKYINLIEAGVRAQEIHP